MSARLEGAPECVRISLGAAMALGYLPGRFRRDARPTCLNLLLAYPEGCAGRCAYCGLNLGRRVAPDRSTFIRVGWPSYPVDEILARLGGRAHPFRRACVSMVTHPDGFENTVALVRLLSGGAELPVTALIAPTAIRDLERLSRLRQAGADRLGIGLDAATPELFERWRGRGQGGPHRWEHYRATVGVAVGLFGRGNVGVHLIVGLGESERQMAATIQKLHDQGAITHLFSFFPEAGTPLGEWAQPPIGQYRRVQLARYIVNERLGRYEDMIFDDSGRIVGYGQDTEAIVRYGEPFRTSGCPGVDGLVACNRPFGNERARDPLRNYPIPLDPEDIELARYQLRDYAAGEAAEQLPPGAAGVPCPPSPDALSGEGS